MSVHYKFKSALEFDTVSFDGLHISVRDLKNAIMQQKRIGKNTDFDLQVTNAQTKEIYDNDETLIPKNTSLLIARIPSTQTKPKAWEGYGGNSSPVAKVDDGGPVGKALDLANADASENEKLQAMIMQSSIDYDPSNYTKIRGANQMGAVPANYRCFRCHQGGHWIKDCQLSQGLEPLEIKKSTGIPRSFMVPVEGPQVQGAMMTPNGSFAVPVLDHQAYTEKPQVPPPEEKQPEIPEDLLCSLCHDLMTDAVMIPCCGDSFCDECIRSCLLESEEHECPACHERDISPGTLIPNRYLRNSVTTFKSTTGYVKRLSYKPQIIKEPPIEIAYENKPISLPSGETEIIKESSSPSNYNKSSDDTSGEKTIIREADSTDSKSINADFKIETEDADAIKKSPSNVLPEGPPGVSPKKEPSSSPKAQRITNVANARSNSSRSHKMNDRSPRRAHHVRSRSPSYQEQQHSVSRNEDRPGTPTVDEPGMQNNSSMDSIYQSASSIYNSGQTTPMGNMMGLPPPSLQGPPPTMPPNYGQVNQPHQVPPYGAPPGPGIPQNFRLPPPGHAPPYMQPGYNAPPRPMYDCARPSIGGGPPSYPPYQSGPPSRGRDYSRELPPRRGRTPPRIIDDPLEAFERMLREKDRRAKQRKVRSYSRSSSRSFSRSPRRKRSRSPRRRTRSRSRSFSISRSRSRSFSPNIRQSPPIRQYSPKRSPHRGGGGHSRFRSPVRSPTRYRYKDQPAPDRGRERDGDREKEFRDRDKRAFSRDRDRERDFRDRDPRDREQLRDRDFQFFDGYERDRPRGRAQWNVSRKDYAPSSGPDPYYHTPDMGGPVGAPPFMATNRYPPRDPYQLPPHHLIPPMMHQHPPLHPLPPAQHIPPPIRRYEDVAPPGTEQPPIPGVENPPRYDDRYYDRSSVGPTSDRFSPSHIPKEKEIRKEDYNIEKDSAKKYDRYSRSPDNRRDHKQHTSPSKQRSSKERDQDHISPSEAKHHKKRRLGDPADHDNKRDSDKERHERKRADASDDEKLKKNKDKKRKKDKREKKEEERRKRKEKRVKRDSEKLSKKLTNEDKERPEKKVKEDDTMHSHLHKDDLDKDKIRSQRHESKDHLDDREDNRFFHEEIKRASPRAITQTPHLEMEEKIEAVIAQEYESQEKQDIQEESSNREERGSSKEFTPERNTINTEVRNELYGDLLSEDIDNSVMETYGKIKEPREGSIEVDGRQDEFDIEEKQLEDGEDDESERDILELHTNEAELKSDLGEIKSEVLAPIPERSKWEMEDENLLLSSSTSKLDTKLEKSGKVTNEVLKRAENAIFAKAINAIRPIEIKKISLDRAKLYSGDREKKDDLRDEAKNIQITIRSNTYEGDHLSDKKVEAPAKPRLSVKERLGCKVDDLDRVIKSDKYDRNRSRTISPLSKRSGELSRNLGQGENHSEYDDKRKDISRSRVREKSPDRHRSRHFRGERNDRLEHRSEHDRDSRRNNRELRREDRKDDRKDERKDSYRRDRDSRRDDNSKRDDRRERDRGHGSTSERPHDSDDKKAHDRKKPRSRSRSSSHDKDRRKRKDKKDRKKEKVKRHPRKEDEKETSKLSKANENETDKTLMSLPKATTDKRKTTLDEANFVPDYDLETESEKEVLKKEREEKMCKRSVSESSQAETPKKKLKVEESKEPSSSSDSSESSSEDEKRKKKHRKHKKKRSRKDSSSSSESESDSDSSEDEKNKKRKKHKKKQKKRKKSKHK